jgi:hypothetical protein
MNDIPVRLPDHLTKATFHIALLSGARLTNIAEIFDTEASTAVFSSKWADLSSNPLL